MQKSDHFNIVIVGGGTAGWMTAASLSQHYSALANITLIDSADIGTVGVGEATIPTIRQFCHSLGISDQELINSTEATCKLGIEFKDWSQPGRHFFHPFGIFGQKMAGIDFHQYWLKLKNEGLESDFWDFSLASQLAKAHRFALPNQQPSSELSVFDWAMHIDAGLFSQLMQKKALANGVKHIKQTIQQVELCKQTGNIAQLALENGQHIQADFFVDCSGFKGLLIEEALHSGYKNWQQWLFCDSAYAMQCQSQSTLPPFTTVSAQPAGWTWSIPLQHRIGQGHVFSSQYTSDAAALELLLTQATTGIVKEPKKLTFVPGRRKLVWQKNCVAIGLSAGFLEPLESTSIALIQTGIERLVAALSTFNLSQAVKDEFNQTTALEYERARDFLIMHYALNQRQHDDFWQHCRQMELPESLQHKLDVYQATGQVVNLRWEIFHQPSWLAVLFGMQHFPEQFDQRIQTLVNNQTLQNLLNKMKLNIESAVAETVEHRAFIRQYCRT
ncbi:tryptophan 7-halogenase [Alteromonadaceae bacterium BrNp21-10]|nr:tryptophan 7-halogenase [Alteromonadaceae bacterium BrNp21-10]